MRKIIIGIAILCVISAQNSTIDQNSVPSIDTRCNGLSSLFSEVQSKSPRIYYVKVTEELTSCITTATQPSQSQIKNFSKALCQSISVIDSNTWKPYTFAKSIIAVMECQQDPQEIDRHIYNIKYTLETLGVDAKKIEKTMHTLNEIRNSAWGRMVIAEFDDDYDGKLSKEERKALFEALGKRNSRSAAIIAMVDKNGNGKLSGSEARQLNKEMAAAFRQQRQSFIKRFDRDNNGTLSNRERTNLNSFIAAEKQKKQQRLQQEQKHPKDDAKNSPPPKKKFKKKK